MNQQARDAITWMLNEFPTTNQDYQVRLLTLDKLLAEMSDTAIIEAAERFAGGEVEGQSTTFPPTGPDIVAEVRRRQEYIDLKAKPRIPVYRHHTGAPFYVRQEKTRTKYSECQILAENLNLDEYRRRVKEFPEGHAWIAALATVFGPPAMEIARRA